MMKDLRYSLRALTKSWPFAVIAIFTLACGIGINTTIFSVVNAVLLRPLPFPHPESMVRISGTHQSGITAKHESLSALEFIDYQRSARTLESIAAFQERSFTINMGDHGALAWGARVSPEIFQALGITPASGRSFLSEEKMPSHENVVIIGYEFWREHFGGSQDVIGKAIILDAKPYTIVGIMPATFYAIEGQRQDFLDEVLVPLVFDKDEVAHRDSRDFDVIARLKPGTRIEQAQAESSLLSDQFRQHYPETYPASQKWGLDVESAHDYLTGDTRSAFFLLWAAAGLVLLIASSNTASLFLGRVLNRHPEFALRMALGAPYKRLLRLIAVEASILATVGCCVAVVLSLVLLRLFQLLNLFDALKVSSFLQQSRISWESILFSLSITLLTIVLASAAPAFRLSRKDFWGSLKQGECRQTGGPSRIEAQKTLAIAQIAIAMVLVTGAGLTVASFVQLLHQPLGFDPNNVVNTYVSLPDVRYSSAEKQTVFFDQVLGKIQALPGVESAGLTNYPVFWGKGPQVCFAAGDGAAPLDKACPEALLRIVSPNYFQTLHIPVFSGHIFTPEEKSGTAAVFVINQTLAHEYFRSQTAVGAKLTIGGRPGDFFPLTQGSIVGVVGDTRYDPVSDRPLPQVYVSFYQSPSQWENLWVRTKVAPESLIPAIEKAVWAVDKDQPLFVPPGTATLNHLVARQQAYQRLLAALFLIFGGLALLMAIIGIYAVSYFFVAQRTSEFGIRMALGARPTGILKLAMGYGLRLTIIGIGIGALTIFLLGRLLQSILYHVRPADPLIIGGVIVLLSGVSTFACYVPARRATLVDPLRVLKN